MKLILRFLGSGKSSFLLAILSFLDYTGTLSIDGQDVRTIPQDYLRNRVTTIAQDGVELSGSVRVNVDPFDDPDSAQRASNEAMEEVLATVGLWDRIKSHGGLDASFSSIGLSHGEKQLLCLARAILHKQCRSTTIVLADEVSSKVDDETAAKMREIMAKAFENCTVITVAHRLETVEDSDLILELEDGNLVRTRRKEADEC
jgi:ABC-type multidrug transport system fused ATPase/permease subunit